MHTRTNVSRAERGLRLHFGVHVRYKHTDAGKGGANKGFVYIPTPWGVYPKTINQSRLNQQRHRTADIGESLYDGPFRHGIR